MQKQYGRGILRRLRMKIRRAPSFYNRLSAAAATSQWWIPASVKVLEGFRPVCKDRESSTLTLRVLLRGMQGELDDRIEEPN